ncbi:MAG TPA: ATP-binding protein [Pirellulales bacterium]|nr:ATP-binding protein [Pirellulales bacterium]
MFSEDPNPADVVTSEVNRRLTQQYQEIAALAGGLAHEIKNPLSTIRLNMELLAEDFAEVSSPRERRALQKIGVVQRECLRLQNLLDDFLSYAKLRRLNLQPTDLNDVIDDVLDFFQPQAEASNISVLRYLDVDLPLVQIDRETFRAALLNLVLNAEQAMPHGGQLVIRTKPVAQGVGLELIDTGVGMDRETMTQIFDAFFSTKPGGSGLGLPTARKIIEAQNGRISVQSEVGRGTKFMIWFPAPPRLAGEGRK